MSEIQIDSHAGARPGTRPIRIAILGGGPGGLMTAYLLRQSCGDRVTVTLYEASDRLGGKILTDGFAMAPVSYEAGAAELYDYSGVGEDPLRELVDGFGLRTQSMNGTGVILDGRMLHSLEDVRRFYGEKTCNALAAFDAHARGQMSPQDYYESDWEEPLGEHAARSFYDELAAVPDADARRYLQTLVHSDLATEPHRTSAEYGLQNYLMNHPEYMRLYTIEGGIEGLVRELARRIRAKICLRTPVVRVEALSSGRIEVTSRSHNVIVSEAYNFVVAALPLAHLASIEWRGEALASAMHRHQVHHDYPGHYQRVSVLFQRPFWDQSLGESYFMLDAFGGCCLYDESSRNDCGSYGVLGWLLAGDAAMTAANQSDERLIEMVLDALPEFLQHGRDLFLEGRVHRWIGSVSGLPAGLPPLPIGLRHQPSPAHPNLLVAGDYLFDSTLNGVLDSATYVAETLAEGIEELAGHAAERTATI